MRGNRLVMVGACLIGVGAFVACTSDSKKGGGTPDASSGGTGGQGTGGNSNATGGGGSGTGGSPVDAGDAGGGIFFTGGVVTGTPGTLGTAEPALAGVQVCIVTTTGAVDTTIPCATTAADGTFSLGPLVPNAHAIAEFSKAGYGTQIKPLDVKAASFTMNPTKFRMALKVTDGGIANFGWDPAVTLDPANGTVNFFAVTSSNRDGGTAAPGFDFVTGVSVTITPAAGGGPFYIDGNEVFRPGATSIGGGGYGGWFVNLPAGEYVLTFSSPTMSCAPIPGAAFGWPEGAHSLRTPVFAGMNTQAVGAFCKPLPSDGGTSDAADGKG